MSARWRPAGPREPPPPSAGNRPRGGRAWRRFRRIRESFPAVLPQRLQLGESGGAGGVGGGDEGLVDQPADDIEDLAGRDLVIGADRLGGCQLTAAGEHRQPGEQAAFVIEEQVVAPVHYRPQGLVAGQRGAGAPGEEPEAVVEAFRHRGQCQCPESGGRELDGQGLAIHSATDVLDDWASVIVGGKSGSYRSGAFDEQLDGGRRRRDRGPPSGLRRERRAARGWS